MESTVRKYIFSLEGKYLKKLDKVTGEVETVGVARYAKYFLSINKAKAFRKTLLEKTGYRWTIMNFENSRIWKFEDISPYATSV